MSYVANKDGGANEVFFFPAALKNNQKGKFKMKKITVFIVSFLLILSTMSVFMISAAEPIAPAMPDNAVAVLDKDGISKALGDNAESTIQGLYGRHYKRGLTAVDFSSAEYVEFDAKFSNFNAIKEYLTKNNATIEFCLTSAGKSSGDVWVDRSSGGNIMNYMVSERNGWHHFSIPKSTFKAKYAAGVDWTKVDTWLLIGEGAGAQTKWDSHYSEKITIANICGTVSVVPAMPDNAVAVLDKDGISNALGDNAESTIQGLYGRHYKRGLTAVDFSSAEYVEFDAKFSNFNAIKEYLTKNNATIEFCLTSAGKSSGDVWVDRSSGGNIMNYMVSERNGWHHFSIPKSTFKAKYAAGVDWTKVDTWLLIGEGDGALTKWDSHYSEKITIANICGTCDFLISDIYDLTDGYVLLNKGTTVADIIGGFNSGAVVYDEKGLRILEGKIYGGMTVSLVRDGFVYDNVITVIKYDLDNDGDVSSTDLVILRKFLLGLEKFTNAQNVAVKGSITGEISVKDLVRMKKNIG